MDNLENLITPADWYSWSDSDPTMGDEKYQRELASAILSASDLISDYCGRKFPVADVVAEAVDGSGTSRLRLARAPILSVVSVGLIDRLNPSVVSIVDPAAYLVSASGGSLDLVLSIFWPNFPAPRQQWPRGTQNIVVSYRGGFEQIPERVKVGCCMTVASLLPMRGVNPRISQDSTGAYSRAKSAVDFESGLPLDVVDMVKKYRRIRVAMT